MRTRYLDWKVLVAIAAVASLVAALGCAKEEPASPEAPKVAAPPAAPQAPAAAAGAPAPAVPGAPAPAVPGAPAQAAAAAPAAAAAAPNAPSATAGAPGVPAARRAPTLQKDELVAFAYTPPYQDPETYWRNRWYMTQGNPLPIKFYESPKPESTEGGRRVSVLRRQEGAPVLLG